MTIEEKDGIVEKLKNDGYDVSIYLSEDYKHILFRYPRENVYAVDRLNVQNNSLSDIYSLLKHILDYYNIDIPKERKLLQDKYNNILKNGTIMYHKYISDSSAIDIVLYNDSVWKLTNIDGVLDFTNLCEV